MNAQVFFKGEYIGSTLLQVGDASMGHLYGQLKPYKDRVRIIQKLTRSLNSGGDDNSKALNDLEINVQLENGYFLFAEGGITIGYIEDVEKDLIQIDIAGVDHQVIEDYLLTNPPVLFVEDPWYVLNIKKKIKLEEMFLQDLNAYTNRFDILFASHHTSERSIGLKVLALCYTGYQGSTVTLYIVKEEGFAKKFVTVDRMVRGDEVYRPKLEIFEDLHHFKYFRMFPDKADWLS
ncbi:hypothetical protein LLH06_14810 [Mucilaginibacter daejeonensis]|uniref:hypothetical protein n=1 Tax=Mucilaginibacter daejeonensis TaxID=398049 RepID=UPI001D17B8C2|nr:hypothetical protein [Mucilaginibacter daejeonensis]UEG52236.1 hypothetical protein LLH06_14810 [Mucilaginibacter daejeonensis]